MGENGAANRREIMTKHIKGNALDYAGMDGYCMIHICNNKGAFVGGKKAIATQVKARYPKAYDNYIVGKHQLGSVSTNVTSFREDDLSVINLVAQNGYGARWKGVKYFDEEAFEKCLSEIVIHRHAIKDIYKIHTIVVPYLMGADRAGGNWFWILDKIEEKLSEHYQILVVALDE